MSQVTKGNKPSSLVHVPSSVSVDRSKPFSEKNLPDGRKIFKRVHGISAIVHNTTNNIEFIVPHNACKITGVNIIAAKFGDNVNFKVYDTPEGMIQQLFYGVSAEDAIPNKFLNQFGFNVYLSENIHIEDSNYPADLIKDMKIIIEYIPKDTGVERDVYINFILHELIT